MQKTDNIVWFIEEGLLKGIFVEVKERLRQSNKGWNSKPGQVPVGSGRDKRRELFPELKIELWPEGLPVRSNVSEVVR